MSKSYEREMNGPELDNQLIRYVKENPAIYDVSHPHYRRNPVRIAIWDRIAAEMNTTSRFLQTKWKNIRYNYLQELKCIETGKPNANVRKRRFTEDLSFLQNTAQVYNVKKGTNEVSFIQNAGMLYKPRKAGKKSHSCTSSSDTEDNSGIYVNGQETQNDIIEIDHSNDSFDVQEENYEPHPKKCNVDKTDDPDNNEEDDPTPMSMVQGTRQLRQKSVNNYNNNNGDVKSSPTHSYHTERDNLSPLLTPLIIMSEEEKPNSHAQSGNTMRAQRTKSQMSHTNPYETGNLMSTFPSNHDSSHLYCLSLVDSFQNMPRSERERVKYEFAKILKEVKYKDQS